MPEAEGYHIADPGLPQITTPAGMAGGQLEVGFDENGVLSSKRLPAAVLLQFVGQNLPGPNLRPDLSKSVRHLSSSAAGFGLYGPDSALDTLDPNGLCLGATCTVEFEDNVQVWSEWVLRYAASGTVQVWRDGTFQLGGKVPAAWVRKGSPADLNSGIEPYQAGAVSVAEGAQRLFDDRIFQARQLLNKADFGGQIPSPLNNTYWREISKAAPAVTFIRAGVPFVRELASEEQLTPFRGYIISRPGAGDVYVQAADSTLLFPDAAWLNPATGALELVSYDLSTDTVAPLLTGGGSPILLFPASVPAEGLPVQVDEVYATAAGGLWKARQAFTAGAQPAAGAYWLRLLPDAFSGEDAVSAVLDSGQFVATTDPRLEPTVYTSGTGINVNGLQINLDSATTQKLNLIKVPSRGGINVGTGNDTEFGTNPTEAVAYGLRNFVRQYQAMAIGIDNQANNVVDYAIGIRNILSGGRGTGIGIDNVITGGRSTAIGGNNRADGLYSVVIGQGSQATANYQFVFANGFAAPSGEPNTVFVEQLYAFKQGGSITLIGTDNGVNKISFGAGGQLLVNGAAVSAGGGSGTSYTDEQAQDAAAALLTGGTHSGISFAYDDAAGKVNATVTGGGTGTPAKPDPPVFVAIDDETNEAIFQKDADIAASGYLYTTDSGGSFMAATSLTITAGQFRIPAGSGNVPAGTIGMRIAANGATPASNITYATQAFTVDGLFRNESFNSPATGDLNTGWLLGGGNISGGKHHFTASDQTLRQIHRAPVGGVTYRLTATGTVLTPGDLQLLTGDAGVPNGQYLTINDAAGITFTPRVGCEFYFISRNGLTADIDEIRLVPA